MKETAPIPADPNKNLFANVLKGSIAWIARALGILHTPQAKDGGSAHGNKE